MAQVTTFDASKVPEITFNVIRRIEAIGLSVDRVTSDIGAGNHAMWRLHGIAATRYGRPETACPHPCGNGRDVHFLADAPHLLQNLRGHLVRQQRIQLDTETVRKHGLPCSEVRHNHITQVCEIYQKLDLKLAPHLKLQHLSSKHYEKMNAGPPCALFASAIRLLVEQGKMPKEALTTA